MPLPQRVRKRKAGVKGTVDIRDPFRSAWANAMGLPVYRPPVAKNIIRPRASVNGTVYIVTPRRLGTDRITKPSTQLGHMDPRRKTKRRPVPRRRK